LLDFKICKYNKTYLIIAFAGYQILLIQEAKIANPSNTFFFNGGYIPKNRKINKLKKIPAPFQE